MLHLLVAVASLPVGVEDGSCVAAEERELIGSSTKLVDGNYGKGTATAGLPIDGDIFWIGLRGSVGRVQGRVVPVLTLTRFVSQAFLEMRRLS